MSMKFKFCMKTYYLPQNLWKAMPMSISLLHNLFPSNLLHRDIFFHHGPILLEPVLRTAYLYLVRKNSVLLQNCFTRKTFFSSNCILLCNIFSSRLPPVIRLHVSICLEMLANLTFLKASKSTYNGWMHSQSMTILL